jgi:hypothetical protein
MLNFLKKNNTVAPLSTPNSTDYKPTKDSSIHPVHPLVYADSTLFKNNNRTSKVHSRSVGGKKSRKRRNKKSKSNKRKRKSKSNKTFRYF